MRSRRWLMLASLACVSIFLIFAVGNVFKSSMSHTDSNQTRHPDEPAPEPNVGVKELTLQVSMDAKEFAVLNQLKQQFQSAHPDVILKLDNLAPGTAYGKWKKAAQLSEAPDIMLLDNSWVTEFAALGYLIPIDSLLTSDLITQQMEQMVNQVKWNGYLWGVPKDVDLYVLAYSTKRLLEFGLDKPPATAEELIALHTAASKPEEGKYGLYADLDDPVGFVTLAKALGGAKAKGAAGPVKLADPAVAKSLETWLTLQKETGKDDSKAIARMFPLNGTPAWKPWELLQQGQMLGMLTTLSDYKLHAKEGLTMAALPLPKGEAVWKSGWLSGRSFAISSRSTYPKEALEWIRELTTASANLKFWSEGFKLPSVSTSYSMGGIRSDSAVLALAGYMEKEEGLPKAPSLSKQLQQLQAELNLLWRGEISWKLFLERTEQQWGAASGTGAAPNTASSAATGADPAPTPSSPAKL